MIRSIILCAGIMILAAFGSISCGGGGGTNPVTPPPAWTSPVHHYTIERFPTSYVVGKQYQLKLMGSVGDAVNATPIDLVVGLYTSTGVLFPYGAKLHLISVGDLFVNEMGRFEAEKSGQKILKTEIRDSTGHLYSTVEFKMYFNDGVLWDSPVARFHVEAQPQQYVVGEFYDVELVSSMGDLIARQPNQIMVGLYRKSDQGAIFSEVIGLKFIPSGASLFINEVGQFTATTVGKKTIIAEIVDSAGHLYITVILHPVFVQQGTPPPTCRELHPVKEANPTTHTYWDCVDGNWEDTHVPVNPPAVTYEFQIHGAQGQFGVDPLCITKGYGYQFASFELVGSDGSKIGIPSSAVEMSSTIIPFWAWDSAIGELMTVKYINPDNPSWDDPGNLFLEPGCYDIAFQTLYSSKTYKVSGDLEVVPNHELQWFGERGRHPQFAGEVWLGSSVIPVRH